MVTAIPPTNSWTNRARGAVAISVLLLVGAFLLGVVPLAPASADAPSGRPFVHAHADGSVWWHDPATGATRGLGVADPPSAGPLVGTPFSFGAAGDYAFSGDAQAVMTAMGNAGLDFAIALGDTTYGATSEQNWCDYFESRVGDGHVLLIAGNHDAGESSGGNINTLRQYCNFGIPATKTGDYAKEYYFDYPQSDPLARFILTGCGVVFNVDGQGKWNCNVGDAHYNFVSNAIDGARDANIPWVIVGMHKNCISNGAKSCEIGEAFQDLLLSKKVDLVLQGHDHNYQRSKQLSCADDNNYRPECVVDSDDVHDHGVGEVINIAGTGGQGTYGTGGRSDEPYFSKWTSSTKGFLRVDVSGDALDVSFQNVVGGYTDSYRIVRTPATPDFSISMNPTSMTFPAGGSAASTAAVQALNGFTGTIVLTTSSAPSGVSTSCVPSSIAASGTSKCTMTGSSAGVYTVTITGTSGGLVHSANVAVTLTTPGPTARFTFSPSTPEVDETVLFDASSSTDTDPGATLEARWDWEGDGTWDTPYSGTLTADHAYTAAGTFPVTLGIRDSNGYADTESHAVAVLDLGAGEAGAPPGYGLSDPTALQGRGPIYIGSNAAFTSANGVRHGTGTAADPYVIRDWLIDGSLYPNTQAMIHVENTDAYVVIENNKIINLAGANHWEAIQLGHWPAIVNTQHVTIRNNHIENARHAYGISAREGSRDVFILANYVHLDANFEWVYGIATDRNVHGVTIAGNYVNAYTSGSFHTSGIHVGDTHIDDARRATGVVVTRNTIINATGGAIVSASSTDTLIGWNLLFMDYPGMKTVGPDFPQGIDVAHDSDGSVVVGNVIHTFLYGVLVGADQGRILSNTIHDVDFGIYVPDDGSTPGVAPYGNVIYNTSMWNVASGTVRLPAAFEGTVVDLGPGIRTMDLAAVTLVTREPATRISYVWTGTQLNLSAAVGGVLAYDDADTVDSQTLSAAWTGALDHLGVSALSPSPTNFRLESPADVAFEGSGFQPSTSYDLRRTNGGGTTTVLSVISTPSGGLLFTIPAAEASDYRLAPESDQDGVAPASTHRVSGTEGTAGWYRSVVSVTLNATDDWSGVASIHVRVDDGTWALYESPVMVSGEGPHTVEYYATDASGNREVARTFGLRIDLTAATTSAQFAGTTASDGSYVESVQVSIRASDALSGVASIAYRIDSGAWRTYNVAFPLRGDGTHLIDYTATDVAGNVEAAKTSVVRISGSTGQPPVSTAAAGGTLGENEWYVSPVQITLAASSPSGAVTAIAYAIDQAAWTVYAGPITVGEGRHTLQWQTSDADGYFESVRSLPLQVDLTAPVVLGLGPTGAFVSAEVTVSWSGSDATSGIARYEVGIDGGPFEPFGLTNQFARSWSEGAHRVQVKAIDFAGHESITETSFTVGSAAVLFPGTLQILPLAFPAIALGLLLLSYLTFRRRRRNQIDRDLDALSRESADGSLRGFQDD